MARTHIDKRSRLVSAAVGLAYQNGFGVTSLADIAREAEVPHARHINGHLRLADLGEWVVGAGVVIERQRALVGDVVVSGFPSGGG